MSYNLAILNNSYGFQQPYPYVYQPNYTNDVCYQFKPIQFNTYNDEFQQQIINENEIYHNDNEIEEENNEIIVECNCVVCRHLSKESVTSIKTTNLCTLILKALHKRHPETEYFTLRTDINEFISEHWDLLIHFKQFQQQNWRKALLDAFNHCSTIESGKGIGQRGLYRLKQNHSNQKSHHSSHSDSQTNLNQITNEKENEIHSKEIIQKDYEFERENNMLTITQEIKIMFDELENQMKYTEQLLHQEKERLKNQQNFSLDLQIHRMNILHKSIVSFL